MKHLLRFLFKRPDGVHIPFLCSCSGGARFSIKCRLVGILADEACHRVLRSLKGAAGLRCCGACKNVIQTRFPGRVARDDFLRWQAQAFLQDFVRQTDDDAWSDIDIVARISTTPGVPKSRVEKVQTCHGCNYEEGALMQDHDLRDVFLPVTHTLYDWMHCAAASSSVGQYEVNFFLRALLDHTGFTLADVDAFAATITFGKRGALGYLRRDFFASRYNTAEGGHIKAFASELMSAVEVLRFFCIVKLDPLGLLPHHSRCMKILAKILCILKMGDSAVPLSNQLLALVELHHKELLQTYGPSLCKPKNHLLYHCPEVLQRLGVNLNCFSNERRNRLLCCTIPHYRGNAAKADVSPIGRLLLDLEFRISTCSFSVYSLVEPAIEATSDLRSVFETRPSKVRLSDAVRTPSGRLTVNQYVWIRGDWDAIGFTSGFSELTYMGLPNDTELVAFVDMYRQSDKDNSVWEPASCSAMVPVHDVAGSVPCMSVRGGRVRPLFPDYL
jgi:hypothetical protein